MLFAKVQRADDALMKELGTISAPAGAQHTPVIRELEADLSPRDDIELLLELLGFEFNAGAPIDHTEVDLIYQVNISCAHRLANETMTIKQVCLGMCAEVERVIMVDPTHGSIARDTFLERGFAQGDALAEGFYTWSLVFRVRVRYPINKPFNQ